MYEGGLFIYNAHGRLETSTALLLQVQDHPSFEFSTVHLLEDLREFVHLLGAEVRLDDSPSGQLESLDGLLPVSDGHADDLLGLGYQGLRVGLCYRRRIPLRNAHADQRPSEAEEVQRPVR